jgi:hypothetical protein
MAKKKAKTLPGRIEQLLIAPHVPLSRQSNLDKIAQRLVKEAADQNSSLTNWLKVLNILQSFFPKPKESGERASIPTIKLPQMHMDIPDLPKPVEAPIEPPVELLPENHATRDQS